MSPFGVCRLLVRLAIAGSCVAIGACQGMYLHDASRAGVAASAKKTFMMADVTDVTKVEQANLDRLLSEELESLQTRARIDADFAMLELADNDQSIARHYVRLKETVAERVGTSEFTVLAQRRFDQIQLTADQQSFTRSRSALSRFKISAPDCKGPMPTFDELQGAKTLDRQQQIVARLAYNRLTENCKRLIAARGKADPAGGALGAALQEAARARQELSSNRDKADKAQEALKTARSEYARAAKARSKTGLAGDKATTEMQEKSKELLEHLKNLQSASPALARRETTGALVDILTALSGGKVDSSDEKIAPAILIAKEVPSLTATVEQAQALRSAPTVSNLLLALSHEVLAAELESRVASLSEEKVSFLETKARMLEEEASLWRNFNDQLCNVAALVEAPNAPHPSAPCATIDIEPEPKTGKEEVRCTLRFDGQADGRTIQNCALSRSWKALFADTKLSSAARRALYEAAIAYLNARISSNRVYEFDFKIVNLQHRMSLALRESALRQWNNIVAVPVEQLDAYYAGGVKPAELADLIVKALGLTAIAIGVAQ